MIGEARSSTTHPCIALRGIIAVMNTPFCDTGAIDYDALAAHARYALEAGVVGFLAPALAGEGSKLTPEERGAVVQTLLDAAAGNVPIIGCATATSDEERMARAMSRQGCAGILASIPFENDADYRNKVHQLARAVSGFLMLQDWAPSGYGIPTTTLRRLAEEVPSFKCIKIETVPAGIKYSEMLEIAKGRLHVSGGWAVTQMIEGLDRGIHAFMPTGLHHTYVAIYRRYKNGDREGAKRLFHRLLPILAFSNQHLDISIHFFKRLLWKQGLYPTPLVRPPSLPFDAFHERIADELIELALSLETSLSSDNPSVI